MSLWSQVGGWIASRGPLGIVGIAALVVIVVLVLARMFFSDRSGMNVRLKFWGFEMERTGGQALDQDRDTPAEVEAEKEAEPGEKPGPGLAA